MALASRLLRSSAAGFGGCRRAASLLSLAAAIATLEGCSTAAESLLTFTLYGDGGYLGTSIGEGGIDSSACFPGSVETFTASYHAAASPQAACRPEVVQPGAIIAADPIALYYDDCFGPHKSRLACTAFAQESPAYAACARCIETSSAAAAYGPLIVDNGGLIRANVAGCIELVDSVALSCAKAVQAQAECEVASCLANCPVTDTASLTDYNECAAAASLGECSAFTMAAACAQASDAGKFAPCLGTTFEDFYRAVVPLFCATEAVDSGTDAAAPAPDASTPAPDASTEDAHPDAPSSGAPDARTD